MTAGKLQYFSAHVGDTTIGNSQGSRSSERQVEHAAPNLRSPIVYDDYD
jgi:hypothetical protein